MSEWTKGCIWGVVASQVWGAFKAGGWEGAATAVAAGVILWGLVWALSGWQIVRRQEQRR